MTKLYHLIRVRDGAYWRPEGHGYTDGSAEAGTFPEGVALRIVADTHGEHKAVEIPQIEEGSSISVSNLDRALTNVIALGKSMGQENSAYVDGLRANLAYLRKHGTLDICA